MKSIALFFAICALALFSATDADAKRYKSGWHGHSSHSYQSSPRRSRASHSRRARSASHSQRSARARSRVQSSWHYAGEQRPRRSRRARAVRTASYGSSSASYGSYSGGGHSVGARPRRWCGWWMRTQLGGGAHYNLARSWRGYGSATAPQVGAVVVQGNHVGIITGRSARGWIVKAGNDGGRVRERVWSLRGASIRI